MLPPKKQSMMLDWRTNVNLSVICVTISLCCMYMALFSGHDRIKWAIAQLLWFIVAVLAEK